MKKIIITLISAVITGIAVDAQDNLRGNWSNIQSVMGTTINEMLTFDSELSGNVYNKVSINLSANMMGVKLDGEMEMSVTGTFEYKEDKLSFNGTRSPYNKRQSSL